MDTFGIDQFASNFTYLALETEDANAASSTGNTASSTGNAQISHNVYTAEDRLGNAALANGPTSCPASCSTENYLLNADSTTATLSETLLELIDGMYESKDGSPREPRDPRDLREGENLGGLKPEIRSQPYELDDLADDQADYGFQPRRSSWPQVKKNRDKPGAGAEKGEMTVAKIAAEEGSEEGREGPQVDLSSLLMLFPSERMPSIHLLDSNGYPVSLQLTACLKGLFYCNKEFATRRPVRSYPAFLSFYRRNYLMLNAWLCLDGLPTQLLERGNRYLLKHFLVTLHLTSNFSAKPFHFVLSKGSAKLFETLTLKVAPATGISQVEIPRFQFKKATPNNGKPTTRDYYYTNLTVQAVCEDGSLNSIVRPIVTLRSTALSVRGRCPSFFNSREEVRIQGHGSRIRERQHRRQGLF